MSLLTVENLVTKYGPITALDGVSLDVDEGETVALLGANGAGKSTTLMSISGILKPSSGRIVFDGQEIQGRPAHEVVHLGVQQCPEGRRIFPEMTVEENLLMGYYTRSSEGKATATCRSVLDLFPVLKDRLQQVGRTLSGGEQQMLAIARALMGKPRLLMLDEPSLGLAPLLVGKVFDILRKIRSEGTTVLLVEQNARMALSIADRAYVLEVGHVAVQGTGRELLMNDMVRKAYLGAQ